MTEICKHCGKTKEEPLENNTQETSINSGNNGKFQREQTGAPETTSHKRFVPSETLADKINNLKCYCECCAFGDTHQNDEEILIKKNEIEKEIKTALKQLKEKGIKTKLSDSKNYSYLISDDDFEEVFGSLADE